MEPKVGPDVQLDGTNDESKGRIAVPPEGPELARDPRFVFQTEPTQHGSKLKRTRIISWTPALGAPN